MPYSGIYVKNQYEYLKSILGEGDAIELFYIKSIQTGKIGSIAKYLHAYIRFIPFFFKKYDILHVHFFSLLMPIAYIYKLFRKKTKIVVTFHGSDINRNIAGKLSKFIYSHLARKIDFAIAVGKDLGNNVKYKLNVEPNKILCAGIDRHVFFQEKPCVKKYDFIFVGSFTSIKGIDLLIQAIKILNRKDSRFCFVGDGYYLNELKQLAKTFNVDIKINLSQDSLQGIYNQSRFLILPSRLEGYGLVIIEAMYCGLPVIISKNCGAIDQIRHGDNGFILKENSIDEIVKAMNLCLSINEESYRSFSHKALRSGKDASLSSVCKTLVGIYGNFGITS